ncbi:hypothetical protein F0U44_12235 [Nocardioides humilatus]|uniref:Uncharacterized protein n=1 Tax=Nocardioides humilatus TaxID=2607660 RepID=A0A5B1LF01_9ACTN|nr:hypothetical protein [Nocardioides humilatus]KAA1419212.1 hypothetical protein F0U44_12235 [Nocardioides humilatus]
MGGLQSGGGTSAVAASAHAGCARFRMTDPFLTRKTRKGLAEHLGAADFGAGIPEARWMRAMTFEVLVHSDRFVSELLTKAIGQLGLPRPKQVARADCGGSVANTAKALKDAHLKASFAETATMISALGVPYLRLEDESATAVQPDFAIACPRTEGDRVVGSWLIMGDAKDYERVRSRIDDGRMLKGFLQVALGAESAAEWSALPTGMIVHPSGALAVPRNAFLQPEAVVEELDDHRTEVRTRAEERLAAKDDLGDDRPSEEELASYVAHLEATFDPASCATCNLYRYCRNELRTAGDPLSELTEIGIPRLIRPAVVGILDDTGEIGASVPESVIAQVTATATGIPVWTDSARTDPAGLPGTIEVVLAKADSAALGVHGIALRRVGRAGDEEWIVRTYTDPQSPLTRRSLMEVIGTAIESCLAEALGPIHLVVPDRPTADLLATAADSLAGVELSRLRWQRDLDMGRIPLTFDGEEATMPDPLDHVERVAVSFLLEEDRARAMSLRSPIVILREVVAAHLVPGGPAGDAGRLDYLLTWAEATADASLDHRVVSDDHRERQETPGARLSNQVSDALHNARKRGDEERYRDLVRNALAYRVEVVERARSVLSQIPISRVRAIHLALELDAQVVWGRRLALQASDLVRFSRTYRFWRNAQVDMLDADARCREHLITLADTSYARDRAIDAGVRELALATVVGLAPVRLDVRSRRLVEGTSVVAIHVNDDPVLERGTTDLKIQAGSFKFGQMSLGPLTAIAGEDALEWSPNLPLDLAIGDQLVLADLAWFGKPFRSGHEIAVGRPSVDSKVAPKQDCELSSYDADPAGHQWCCKPHRVAEGEWADTLAERRANGQLNPEVWPPLVDEERFDVGDGDLPEIDPGPVPDGMTIDTME